MKQIPFLIFFVFLFVGRMFAQDSLQTNNKPNPSVPDSSVVPDTINGNLSSIEEAPECINLPEIYKKIVYPPDAVWEHIEGETTIKLLIDTSGHVEKTGKFTGPLVFITEVVRVSKLLLFKPGRVNGIAVKVWVTVPFTFILKN